MKLFVAVLLLSTIAQVSMAHAETLYFVNGKQVANVGIAKVTALKDPSAVVVKIQATRVALNSETLNLKKSGELTVPQIKELLK